MVADSYSNMTTKCLTTVLATPGHVRRYGEIPVPGNRLVACPYFCEVYYLNQLVSTLYTGTTVVYVLYTFVGHISCNTKVRIKQKGMYLYVLYAFVRHITCTNWVGTLYTETTNFFFG